MAERFPEVPIRPVEEVAEAAMVLLAVPDPQLADVAAQVAQVTRDGQIVAHTSGAQGCAVLQPVTDTGALPLALHPVMTFAGEPDDADRLVGCPWGITTDSEVGRAVGELFVQSVEGVPIHVPEHARPAYHAAIAYAANYVVTLLSDAQRMLDHVLAEPMAGPPPRSPDSAVLLRTIVGTAVDRALERRMDGLTGPVARDDAPAVLRHIDALAELDDASQDTNFAAAYIPMAERTAQMLHSIEVERVLSARRGGLL